MDIGAIVTWITTNWANIGMAVLSILGGFSIIAKLTPTKADDKVIDAILKIVHAIGLTK